VLPAHLKPLILEVISLVLLAHRLTCFLTQNCREHNGAHSCDKRRPKSEVQSDFPNVVFEEGFPEEDVTWTSEREPTEHMEKRAKLVLDRVFQDNHDDTCAHHFLFISND
jgi:hypothetical protein